MKTLFFIILVGLSITNKAHGIEGDFVPLVGLPYVGDNGGPENFGDYVKALYYAAISVGALLAVVKIIFAGVKYMLTDVVTTKGDAKKDIYGAFLGLFIVIGAVLILQTINPRLLEINLFTNAPVAKIQVGNEQIGNNYNIKPGTSVLDTDGTINKTLWIKSCTDNGGQASVVTEGDGFNIFTTYKCTEKEEPDSTPTINESEIIKELCPNEFECEYKQCQWSLLNQCGSQCTAANGYLDNATLGCVILKDTITENDKVNRCVSHSGTIKYNKEDCAIKSCTPKGGTVEIGVVINGELKYKDTPVCVIRN
jgi:hypothetical protein